MLGRSKKISIMKNLIVKKKRPSPALNVFFLAPCLISLAILHLTCKDLIAHVVELLLTLRVSLLKLPTRLRSPVSSAKPVKTLPTAAAT